MSWSLGQYSSTFATCRANCCAYQCCTTCALVRAVFCAPHRPHTASSTMHFEDHRLPLAPVRIINPQMHRLIRRYVLADRRAGAILTMICAVRHGSKVLYSLVGLRGRLCRPRGNPFSGSGRAAALPEPEKEYFLEG